MHGDQQRRIGNDKVEVNSPNIEHGKMSNAAVVRSSLSKRPNR